ETRPRILESFLGSQFGFCGALFQECLKLIDRREEIVHVLAFTFQIPCNPPGVRDRLLREPLPRFLSEFCRVGPLHSSACHRSIPSDNCQPETLSPVLSAIVTANEVLTNDRLSRRGALGDIYKSSTFHVGHLSDAAPN